MFDIFILCPLAHKAEYKMDTCLCFWVELFELAKDFCFNILFEIKFLWCKAKFIII